MPIMRYSDVYQTSEVKRRNCAEFLPPFCEG